MDNAYTRALVEKMCENVGLKVAGCPCARHVQGRKTPVIALASALDAYVPKFVP